ncbi:MAG: AAA family ATPase [Streptosporangiales bacterium]|nr:AAA family ATPase [Streptosporangiales bacterium]
MYLRLKDSVVAMPTAAVDKPSWVFDRDYEWDVLANFVRSGSPRARLGVVSGRRRQGKTFLLRALAEATNAFYYAAAETTATDSLRDLGTAIAARAGGALPYAIGTWDEAIRALRATFPDGLVIIDEFPYLIRSDPSLPSLMQRALDDQAWGRQEQGTRFLLCGSAMSVMGSLLAGNAPLRGRSALELMVAPFDYRTAARFWGIEDDPALAVLVHSIVGGTPAYRSEFVADDVPESRADFDAWVTRTVLNPAVPLFREARYLLAEETDIREPAIYNAVLGAIAEGNATRGGIANYVGRKSSELLHPLTVLEDAGLITRADDPFHARKSQFEITEPLIAFYQTVMRPAWTQLEQRQAATVWQRQHATFSAKVVGPHFEAICRDWAAREGASVFGEFPAQVAAATINDGTGQTQIEVDVAVRMAGTPQEPGRILSLGEAKWGEVMGIGHLNRLRRARDLLAAKKEPVADAVLACYSGAGFTDELRELAASDPRVLLVSLQQLYA